MQIPKTVKVGGITYDVVEVDHDLCVNQKEVHGKIEYNFCKITIRSDMQSKQLMELTFLHELVHAMARERNLDWGDNDELYTEELAKALHCVIKDNPDIFKD
jgi:hypothetical protein